MTRLLAWLRGEPVVLLVGVVGSLIELGMAFGLDLTDRQQKALLALPVALMACVARQFVRPTSATPEAAPPSLPPWPVAKAELASAVADRITARKEAHAPAQPRKASR